VTYDNVVSRTRATKQPFLEEFLGRLPPFAPLLEAYMYSGSGRRYHLVPAWVTAAVGQSDESGDDLGGFDCTTRRARTYRCYTKLPKVPGNALRLFFPECRQNAPFLGRKVLPMSDQVDIVSW